MKGNMKDIVEQNLRFMEGMSAKLAELQQEMDTNQERANLIIDELLQIKKATDTFIQNYERDTNPGPLSDNLYQTLITLDCYK